MADNKVSVRKSEREANLIFLEDDDKFLDQELTRDEWDKLIQDGKHSFLGIDWEGREQWLKDNSYEVTRENLRDASLPTRGPEFIET